MAEDYSTKRGVSRRVVRSVDSRHAFYRIGGDYESGYLWLLECGHTASSEPGMLNPKPRLSCMACFKGILAMVEGGYTNREIAAHYHLSMKSVWYYLNRQGTKR